MLILVGPSASGKTEVAKLLDKKYHLVKVITHTTRPMRINERDNVDYHFVDKHTFLNLKNNNEFVETTFYNGNYYGTSKNEVADNKCVVLDPEGAKSFSALNDPRIYIVFLECSKEIRYQRMIARKDDLDKINARLILDNETFKRDNISFANEFISSENTSPDELTQVIFNKYQKHLSSLK